MPVVLNSGAHWTLLGVVSSTKTGRQYFGYMWAYSKMSFLKLFLVVLSTGDQNTTVLLNGGAPEWKCATAVIWLNLIPMFSTSVKKFLYITNCLKKDWHELVRCCYFTNTFHKYPSAVRNRHWLNCWNKKDVTVTDNNKKAELLDLLRET